VEDNEVNAKLVRTILKISGFDVLVAPTGEAALEMLQTARPRVILTDIQMPGMDGVELARTVKRRPELVGVKVVALTAYAMRGDRERFLSQGLDGYISKPIDPSTFPALVKSYIDAQA
jgi:CheY-like chemotaxis protein